MNDEALILERTVGFAPELQKNVYHVCLSLFGSALQSCAFVPIIDQVEIGPFSSEVPKDVFIHNVACPINAINVSAKIDRI
jgi:hypothetical protein